MDSPLPVALTSDSSHASVEAMEDKCNEIMAATHRTESYEGLLTLPVHFSSHSASPNSESEVNLHNRPSLHTVVLDSSVFERWRQFGTNNGLTSDSNIATYLLHHFETSHSLTRCVNCQAMLPLYCPKCSLHPPLGLNSTPSSNPVIMATSPLAAVSVSRDNTNGNTPLAGSLPTSLASFVMGASNSMELTTTSLADLQSADLASVPCTPDLKGSVDDATSSLPSPKKAQQGKKKKKKGKVKVKKEPYTCTECGTHITPKPKPSASRRRAAGVQPYRCMDCHQAFAYRRLLEDHLFSKETNGSFKCRHCQAVVLNPGDMRKHSVQHTADMPYKCSHCPLAFSLACNLKTHLRTHSGERPFPCGVCGRAFTQSIALKVHIRKHTGERPFTCPHCPMAFAASSNLSRHLLKHTGQKPYRCAYCSAAFSQPGSLKTHTRSKHTGERPYVCEHCAAAFSDHSTLWKHRRNNSCHGNSSVSAARAKKQAALPPPPSAAPTLLPPPLDSAPLHQTVAQQVRAVIVSQGASQHLATPTTSVMTNQFSNVSMSVLSAAAAVVSQQQVYRQPQQQQVQQQQVQHQEQVQQQQQQQLQLQQAPPQPIQTQPLQQQQEQQHHQQQVQQQQQQQQQPPIEGATFVLGVGWCFPVHQQ